MSDAQSMVQPPPRAPQVPPAQTARAPAASAQTARAQTAAANDRRRVTVADVCCEFIAHRDNWPFLGLAAGIAAGLLASGPALSDLAWAALGLLLFIPQEYFTHVHLLHLPIPASRQRYTWMYRLHYGHHDHPRRHDLMYMPLWLTLPMMLGNMLMLWAVTAVFTSELRAFWAAFGGALVGYLVFEWAHLLCHVPVVPRSRLWRNARTQHLLHHFADETRGYSVAPWSLPMDRLMGTRALRDAPARSASCRFLGLDAAHPWLAQARARFAARSSGDATCSRLWLRAGPAAAATVRPTTGPTVAPAATAATAAAKATLTTEKDGQP